MNRLENLVALCMPCHHRYERLPNERAKELIR
jgi:5-methylcytosine-specific restriction endonuclease McrA